MFCVVGMEAVTVESQTGNCAGTHGCRQREGVYPSH